MRYIVNYFVRKRNAGFAWPVELPVSAVFGFVWEQCFNLLRGAKVLLMLRHPRMMLRGRRVALRGISLMRWGSYLKLGNDVYINAVGIEGVTLGAGVSIGAFSRVVVSGSLSHPGKGIVIGNNVGIGEFAYLGGAGGLEIGDNCIAGQYLSCHPENHVTDDLSVPFRLQGVTRKGIRIGKNCWLGSKVTILDGVVIGNNCVVAAGAVVTKSFPDNCVIGGVPSKIIRHLGEDSARGIMNTTIREHA